MQARAARLRIVSNYSQCRTARQAVTQRGQAFAHCGHDRDNVLAGLLADRENHTRVAVLRGVGLELLRAIFHTCDITESGRMVAFFAQDDLAQRAPVSMLPRGVVRFWLASARCTSLPVKPAAVSCTGSAMR
jgi:hypothetical protein